MKLTISLIFILSSLAAMAAPTFLDTVKRTKWDDLEVVWVEDDRFPKFTASIYFQEGAITDPSPGITQATFDLFTSGTNTETQRQISEFFDFYGVKIRNSVTHEYSVMSVSGLVRDIDPVMTKFCQIFKHANYPDNELKSYVSRSKSGLNNLITSHSSLADRIFRQVSLEGTPFSKPVDGTLKSFDELNSQMLRARLNTLSASRKVLYLAGPKDIYQMEKNIRECGWKNESKVSKVELPKSGPQTSIYLVPVPGANQAQIRIGRYLTQDEVNGKEEHFQFLSSFLGGSFTSKLVQELRVKRGLTYSAGAYVSMQRDYGRAGITTFSKTETAAETISLIRDVFQDVSTGKFTEVEFKHQQGHQIGAYAFGFEETGAFIGQLMLYDHQQRDLQELVNFQQTIANLKMTDLAQTNFVTFPWDRQTIVVVGDPALEKDLSRIRPVTILKYKDFL